MLSSGITTKVKIQNVYNPWDGELYQVKDQANKVLWELKNVDAKGNVLEAKLGKTTINNTYDANNFLTNINHSSDVKPGILQISYSFNSIKNELNSRITGGDFNILENFEYDDNNRLMRWTNPRTGQFSHQNVYDAKGRIISNDQIGTIKFGNTTKIYQPTGAELNAQGEQNYTNDLIQKIKYNENNDPTYIDGLRGDFGFQYGLSNMRQRMSYGGNFGENEEGHFTKYYSEDNSFEIIRDNSNGTEKHILYIGGTPYESNIVFIKNYAESEGSFKFLHKDYLGSILAISDEAGNKLEQRHYDAWGILTHLQIGNGAVITDDTEIQNITEQGGLILDRGYTSHEHLWEVKLIHMNGRLYDPLLRRFLNADENIQDPHNTQNYNKYGYVMNNPLMFNDPSGEFFEFIGLGIMFWKAVIIGAAVGLVSYSLGVAIAGQKWNLGNALKSTFFGAVSGAVTCGIGDLFKVASVVKAVGNAKFLIQGMAHGVSQGVLSVVQGGKFLSGAAAGFFGNLGAEAWGASMKGLGLEKFASSTVGTISFGALSGGVGAELTGGNFWNGVIIGGIVAGLNHVAHSMLGPGDPKPKYYNKKPTYDKNNPLHEHYNDAITLEEWVKIYGNKSYDEVLNERGKNSMGYGSGPKYRFVFNPVDGNVMDMTHVMEVGFRFGGENIYGVGNEIKQWFQGLAGLDPQKSAFNSQDFYSNKIGNQFYYYRLYETAYNVNGNIFDNWVKNFNKYFTK